MSKSLGHDLDVFGAVPFNTPITQVNKNLVKVYVYVLDVYQTYKVYILVTITYIRTYVLCHCLLKQQEWLVILLKIAVVISEQGR